MLYFLYRVILKDAWKFADPCGCGRYVSELVQGVLLFISWQMMELLDFVDT